MSKINKIMDKNRFQKYFASNIEFEKSILSGNKVYEELQVIESDARVKKSHKIFILGSVKFSNEAI